MAADKAQIYSLKGITMRVFLLFVALVLLTAMPISAQSPEATAIIRVIENPTYYFARPFSGRANKSIDAGFPYGWHRSNRSPLHHGVDIGNPRGTPVLAVADGTVYYAGADTERVFGEKANFYGNLIILQHSLTTTDGAALYTLYGHLSAVDVAAGAAITAGQAIGKVGATGIALGSHLHFEVRVGNPDDYFATRNPEVWLAPLPTTGTVVGRILDAAGNPAMGVRYTLSGKTRAPFGFTYADPNLPSVPAYNENFAITDVVEGCYSLRVRGGAGYVVNEPFCIKAGQTVYIEVKFRE